MADYLDRDKLIDEIDRQIDYYSIDDPRAFTPGEVHEMRLFQAGIKQARKAVFKAPTADVQLVRHGNWRHPSGDNWFLWECSECGAVEWHIGEYCRNCGAKMDGGGDDG